MKSVWKRHIHSDHPLDGLGLEERTPKLRTREVCLELEAAFGFPNVYDSL